MEPESPHIILTADIIIEQADGRIVLVKRANPPFQGQWALPGGMLDGNESIQEAAVREALEETGMTLTDVKELGTVLVPWNGQQLVVFFSAQSEGSPKLSDEHVDWFWMNKFEVPLRNFSALTKPVLNFIDGKELAA